MNHPITSAKVDLGAIAHNVKALRGMTDKNARLMAVVKANGYGHGADAVARTALKNGADELAVVRFNEAKKIREAGIEAPLLLFGYASPERTAEMLELNLRPTINSLVLAEAISREAGKIGKKLKVHVKIDTGMGRMGLLPDGLSLDGEGCIGKILAMASLPFLELEGVYTHFANADSIDKSYSGLQFERFQKVLETLKNRGFEFPVRHAANSAAIITMPETHLDMVRPGISIYGFYPGDEVDKTLIDLKPAMALKTTVVQVKEVPAGFKISYGGTYETGRPTKIATVSLGYADGYSRLLSSKGSMLVHGQRAPILGRVCMDFTMIDVSHIENVTVGDEVVAFGIQGEAQLHVDEIAGLLNTINYEIVSTITNRVPRIYE